MSKVDFNLIKDIKKYKAFDIQSCFNCGNCTAVCPLSDETDGFPRRLIRAAHTGQKDVLLNSKEPWLCYYCGECTNTCPREADPGAFMAALRRYSTAKSDITGLSGLMFKNGPLAAIILTIIAVVLGLFMYSVRLETPTDFKPIEGIFHISFEFVHYLGQALMGVASLSFGIGILLMLKRTANWKLIKEFTSGEKGSNGKLLGLLWKSLISTITGETIAFKRFQTCDEEKQELSFLKKPWVLHAATVFGFMGLFAATSLNFLFKDPSIQVALWYPPRLLGTISGLLLMYGTSMIAMNRFNKTETSYADSTFADWWFLGMLWWIGLSGFVLEVLVYLPIGTLSEQIANILFLLHVGPAMELVLLASFTKLSHVIYRPLALILFDLEKRIKAI